MYYPNIPAIKAIQKGGVIVGADCESVADETQVLSEEEAQEEGGE